MATYTNRARRDLADCQHAWDRLELAIDDVEFRLSWVAAVALIPSLEQFQRSGQGQLPVSPRRE